jgi:hypothetical protein
MYYRGIPNWAIWEADSKPLRQGAANTSLMARGRMAKIDAELKTYYKCYTPVAKTNVLSDLRTAIAIWIRNRRPPGPVPSPMAELLEVVDRTLDFRPTGSRYNKAICIAYHTNCNYDKAGKTIHDDSGLNDDYFRHSDNDVADAQAKCGRLWNAIVAANDAIAANGIADDDRTLKIFMAPEFYFRGRNGAYSPDIVYDLPAKMRKIGTGAGTYQHWLFIFGTAVSAFEVTEHICATCPAGTKVRFDQNTSAWTEKGRSKTTPRCTVNPAHKIKTKTYGAEVQNVALIQHGNVDHAIAKEYVSGIDYKGGQVTLREGRFKKKNLDTISPLGSTDNPGNKPVESDERLGGSILTVDGVTVGMEICLDHAHEDEGAPEMGRASHLAPTIQILLIPSYGMSIGQGMHCKDGGIVFNVDGMVKGSSEVIINTLPLQSEPDLDVGSDVHIYGPFPIP